jgi:hypothetical protein
MWPFSVEFVPKGEPEGCEWRGRVRGRLHPLQMGAGVRSLFQHIFCSWLDDLAVGTVLWRVAAKPLSAWIAW